MRKRDFLAAMAVGTLATGVAKADDYIHGKNLGAAPPQKKKDVPHRKVTTRNLFKVPHGYPNGVAIAPEGLWVGEQKAQGYGKDGGQITEVVLEESHFWSRNEITIPVDAVQTLETDTVVVRLSAEEIAELPTTRVRRWF